MDPSPWRDADGMPIAVGFVVQLLCLNPYGTGTVTELDRRWPLRFSTIAVRLDDGSMVRVEPRHCRIVAAII